VTPSCGACVFFSSPGKTWGSCRRNPPVVVTGIHAVESQWPEVQVTEWCGEFKVMPEWAKRKEGK
jgi:hypothetical protein